MNTEEPNDENKTCKYLKVTSSDIALGNQSVNEGFTSVLRFTSTRMVLNKAFRFFLGDQSLEDFIIDTVKNFLSTLFEFGNDGTVKIKGNTIYENITIEGDASIRNLKVEGSTKFESDLTATGTITAYGGFTSADPSNDMYVDPNTDPNAIPDADPNSNQNA